MSLFAPRRPTSIFRCLKHSTAPLRPLPSTGFCPSAFRSASQGNSPKPSPNTNKPQRKKVSAILPPGFKIHPFRQAPRARQAPPRRPEREDLGYNDLSHLSKEELADELKLQEQIVRERKKLLGPGIFAVCAVVGIYGSFAYLDSRYGSTQCSPQTPLPTPATMIKGLKAGWQELDKLTIGLVILNIGVHLMKRSSLPFWEFLPHVAGETKFTLLTHAFAHSGFFHVASTVFCLIWFMPPVIRELDGDYFHAAAFYLSVPVLTGFLTHFQFKFGRVKGMPIEMGASGALSALLGACIAAYPHEKIWVPILGQFNVEVWLLGAAYTATEAFSLWRSLRRRTVGVAHGVSSPLITLWSASNVCSGTSIRHCAWCRVRVFQCERACLEATDAPYGKERKRYRRGARKEQHLTGHERFHTSAAQHMHFALG